MKAFIIVVALVVAAILGAWGWFGGFNRVRFEMRAAGGETVVVERVTGDYSQSPAVMKRVYERLLADGVATTRGIGIYYDKPGGGSSSNDDAASQPQGEATSSSNDDAVPGDPGSGAVPRSEMRSDIGCIIDPTHSASLSTADSLAIDLSTLAVLSAKYDVKTLPEGRFVVCEFPWRGSLSALVGIAKVYPALERFCTANDIPTDTPVTEIYDIPNKKIVYRREIR